MYKIIKGTVIHGESIGKTIGFPTANIQVTKNTILEGTYKINAIIDDNIISGVGVYIRKKGVFESNFFNFDKNIYGKEIEIVVLYKIRENKKFDNLNELKKQIENDIAYVKEIKDNVLTFGTFDKVHEGHKYYLKNAKKYGDKLITIVATDKNIEKFKKRPPTNKIDTRIKDIKDLNISDEVLVGKEDKPLIWIEIYNPKVICLGYDQRGFKDKLFEYIEKNNLNIKIIIINSYKPEIYKSSKIGSLSPLGKGLGIRGLFNPK